MLRPMNTSLESVRFACEVQGIISMRQVRLTQGGPQAAPEANLMIAEKVDAFADAGVALVNALAHGEGFLIAAERA